MRDALAPDPLVKRAGKEAVPDAVTEDFARARVLTGVGDSPRGARFTLTREPPERLDRGFAPRVLSDLVGPPIFDR